MPRQARLDYPGMLHHVLTRGMDKKAIFRQTQEKKEFLRRPRELLKESSMKCCAWCVMDNHAYLSLLAGNTKLSEFMRRLLSGYAAYYNHIRRRSERLFQNRYKSIVCDRDEYLLLPGQKDIIKSRAKCVREAESLFIFSG